MLAMQGMDVRPTQQPAELVYTKCRVFRYEPVKQNVILYSSVGQQINPGTLFVAGLRKCNRRYSQSPTLQPSLPEALTSNMPTLMPTKVSTYPHSWDALPSCVHRDTYLIGHTVTNIVGDPNCGTGTGVLPASTIEMASMKCEVHQPSLNLPFLVVFC